MGRINQLTPTTIVTTDSVIAVDAANGGVTNKLTINTLAGGLRVIGNYATQAQLAAKQDVLTFDDSPEEDSDNPVTSGGIYNAIGSAMSNVYTKAETDNAIAQSTAISNVTITMESGFTSNLFARKSGNVVSINGYVTANSAFTSTETKIGNVAAGARPGDIIRMPVSISGAGYNPPTGTGIMFISANGNINVVAPASNTNKVIYFSVAYIAQN